MFANKQVENLFDKINALNSSASRVGFDAVLTSVSTVDLWNLRSAPMLGAQIKAHRDRNGFGGLFLLAQKSIFGGGF